ncbi:Pre-mRNA-splicing factor ATP-dependent RNA helicase [Corchorus olitorius]|uniref:Pre-mRNA-splicing factor ATP-dependent RNA helicase n=1 Tax=Corchorus olitorius TaxID=93759 RepID=A0A1R3FXF0_9ROSI|nr:Pre-mRNA-splicing factor ATP-dependent RNA helicase [Corchorus olitorius]
MNDIDIPDSVDIMVDVESEGNGEEPVENNSDTISNAAAAGDEGINSNSKTVGPAKVVPLLASINEALLDLFEDYRRACNPFSNKGSAPEMSSQANSFTRSIWILILTTEILRMRLDWE